MAGSRELSDQGASHELLWAGATLFSLIAFAANSIFCRLALRSGDIDPESFTAIRLLSGAIFLLVLMKGKGTGTLGGSWRGGLYLFVYAYLFSLAYTHLDAGVGALILFGAVQITMFVLAWANGEKLRPKVATGMLIAFAGLIVLLSPGGSAPPLLSALAMVIAGAAWGIYSMLGKASTNPVSDSAGNFLRSLPLVGLAGAATFAQGQVFMTPAGALYAVASGALASGAGYALWYAVIARMSAQTAATLQLSVPVIASVAGVILLDEPLSARLLLASLIVLGGIGFALLGARRKPQG
jgi:drug/metabolite transporter (DMT)-like permease